MEPVILIQNLNSVLKFLKRNIHVYKDVMYMCAKKSWTSCAKKAQSFPFFVALILMYFNMKFYTCTLCL